MAKARAVEHRTRIDAYTRQSVAEGRWDADTGLYLAEELTHVSAEMVKFSPQDYKFAELIPPVMDPPPEGASVYAWDYLDWSGNAKLTGSLEGDSPRANVQRDGRNKNDGVYIRGSYGYADDEIARQAMAGLPLSREKPLACIDMIMRLKDSVFFLGDANFNVTGLLSDANVNDVANPGGALSGLSAANLFAFYMGQVHALVTSFGDNDSFTPDTLLLPKVEYLRMRSALLSVDSRDTVYRAFLQENGYVNKIDYSRHMNTSGTGTTKQMLLYRRDPRIVGRIESVTYRELAPQRVKYETNIEANSRIHGTAWRVPKSARKTYNL